MADSHRIKGEIISFVRNSTEEEVSKVAVFIAGMQAQKSLPDCQKKANNGLSVVKIALGKK
ncbi:MAG: hypothetical protein LBI28_06655 [Treponema sp.]|jgi:hypothetical protein|nr:hypothetical protein [Treponema sp.]